MKSIYLVTRFTDKKIFIETNETKCLSNFFIDFFYSARHGQIQSRQIQIQIRQIQTQSSSIQKLKRCL